MIKLQVERQNVLEVECSNHHKYSHAMRFLHYCTDCHIIVYAGIWVDGMTTKMDETYELFYMDKTQTCHKCNGAKQEWNGARKMMEDCVECKGVGAI